MEYSTDEGSELSYHPSPTSEPDTADTSPYCRTSSDTSAFSCPSDESSCNEEPTLMSRLKPIRTKSHATLSRLGMKQHSNVATEQPEGEEEPDPELEMMKEKFSKLLLGEDMSGGGKGVCTAVAISNSITNLYATVFGQNLRLEPLHPEKKSMWRREMDCLLSLCDYIIEFTPKSDSIEDGTDVEVTTTRPRSDIYMNLPALQKLDNMLLQEVLESFRDTEFWYAERGSLSSPAAKSASFHKVTEHKEEKWWLPVPCVPPGGLSEKARKQLQHKRDCANQIHKAAMAINNCVLDEMSVPDSFMAGLPKSGRASLGDMIYRYMSTADKFSSEYILDCVEIHSEHEALELADRIEASIYIWRRKVNISNSKSSWNLMADAEKGDKNHILAGRAESLLLSLKQRYPELSQTTLDTCKIQYNKDVGQAILESYSRVLESLAFNLVSWIDEVLYVDSTAKTKRT